jgi:hypothetical protein
VSKVKKRKRKVTVRRIGDSPGPVYVSTECISSNFARSGNSTVSVTIMTHPRPCWACIDNETGTEVSVRMPRDRWFDSRAEGCRQLGQLLGRYVGNDAVRLEWVE